MVHCDKEPIIVNARLIPPMKSARMRCNVHNVQLHCTKHPRDPFDPVPAWLADRSGGAHGGVGGTGQPAYASQ